ncbi:hypothetical protein DXG03_007580 [Asterophora parasitica]|uniref:Hemerythrin-like domain-containing protein n=1 Tax=Asterophora parasitica TaxID=117018 RepID=A0A9P7KDH4_9AGAR|nr:hypothetical protein DXG03_007580 [Asterophora parasitica]
MEHNVEQHHAFLAGLESLEAYIKEIQAGNAQYDGKLVIEKLDSFADGLVQHLHDELPTLASSRMRAAFTEKDLKDLETSLGKRILKEVSLTTVLPLGMVLHDKSTAPQYVSSENHVIFMNLISPPLISFPPLPKPILWATQYGLYHLHSDAWAFGPCDVYGKVKPGFGNDASAA